MEEGERITETNPGLTAGHSEWAEDRYYSDSKAMTGLIPTNKRQCFESIAKCQVELDTFSVRQNPGKELQGRLTDGNICS